MTRSRPERTPLLERLFAGHHDILAALRSLRRSPGFVAIAVLSLGLGIALTTTTYALLDAIRRPYVPYAEPNQLYSLGFYAEIHDIGPMMRDMYLAVRRRHDLYAALAPLVYDAADAVIEANSHLIQGHGSYVSRGMLDVLGIKLFAGRMFSRTDHDPTDQSAVIVSYEFWHDHLGENPDLGASKITYGDRTYTVIGVLPPSTGVGGSLWLPMPVEEERSGLGPGYLGAVMRLKPGDTKARVKTQLDALSAQFISEHRSESGLFDYRMETMAPGAPPIGGFPMVMALATTLVLFVTCLNLANLLLARGLARQREIAVRLALSASRVAIIRHVLTECALLAGLGGAWGILLSAWGVKLAQSRMPSRIARLGLVPPHLNWRVVTFGIAVTAATVVVAGMLPAVRAAHGNVNEAMKDGGAGSTGRRTRSYRLVVALEIALALFLTMGATFALQDLYHEAGFQFSYDAAHQLSAFVSPGSGCPASDTASHFWTDMATRASAVAGVRYAAIEMTAIPKQSTITSDQPGAPIEIILGEGKQLGYQLVSPDYFRVFGYPIVAGRDFERGDAENSGTAIVNRKTAVRLWPFTSPVGREVKLGPAMSKAPWVRVVGVVGPRQTTARDSTVDRTPDLTVVRPMPCKVAQIYARTNGNPLGPAIALYRVVRAAVPARGLVTEFGSAKADFEQQLRVARMTTLLFVTFGIFALLLSAFGVYGVLNYAVGQRRREFAMRSALGAQAPDLRNIVLKDALEMALGGTALGATTALIIGHGFSASAGIGVVTLVVSEVVVGLCSLAACVGPIRRALRSDPVELLRST